jgi:lysozyme
MRILITEEQLRILVEQNDDIESITDGLRKAIQGFGTNEEAFYGYLGQIKSKSVFDLVNKKLKEKYKEDFYKMINSFIEFTDEEKNKIISILNKNKIPQQLDADGNIIPKKPIVSFLDPSTLNPSQKLHNFLMYEEGDPAHKGEPVLVAYKKKGDVWTIGYGHTSNVKKGMKISKQMALKFLKDDAAVSADCVRRIFNEWKSKGIEIKITQSMFDTLVSLAFNAGCGSLRGGSGSGDVIDYVKKGQFYTAAQKIKTFNLKSGFSGLIGRREKESKMFCEQGGCTSKSGVS